MERETTKPGLRAETLPCPHSLLTARARRENLGKLLRVII